MIFLTGGRRSVALVGEGVLGATGEVGVIVMGADVTGADVTGADVTGEDVTDTGAPVAVDVNAKHD